MTAVRSRESRAYRFLLRAASMDLHGWQKFLTHGLRLPNHCHHSFAVSTYSAVLMGLVRRFPQDDFLIINAVIVRDYRQLDPPMPVLATAALTYRRRPMPWCNRPSPTIRSRQRLIAHQ